MAAPQTPRTATPGPAGASVRAAGERGRRTDTRGRSDRPLQLLLSPPPRNHRPGRWGPSQWVGGPDFPAGRGHGVSQTLSFFQGTGDRVMGRKECPNPTWFVLFGMRCIAAPPPARVRGRGGGGRTSAGLAKACADLHEKGRVAWLRRGRGGGPPGPSSAPPLLPAPHSSRTSLPPPLPPSPRLRQPFPKPRIICPGLCAHLHDKARVYLAPAPAGAPLSRIR